jgi:integrase/recombinase XerC
MRLSEAVRQFYFYLSSNGHSRRTAILYRNILESLPDVELEQVTPAMLQYLGPWQHLSPATRNLRKATIRSFFNWLVDAGHLDRNPARLLRSEKIPQTEARYLPLEAVAKFRKALEGKPRDNLLFTLYLETGMRLREVLGLDIGQVKGRDTILIVGKGRKARTVFLSPHLTTMIVTTLNGAAPDTPLFQSAQGRRLSASRVQGLFKGYLKQAGIKERFGVHSLRHSFATEIYRRTHDLRLTQELLGHANPSTTARYAHVLEEQKRAAVANLF